jgi:hypothetical protein
MTKPRSLTGVEELARTEGLAQGRVAGSLELIQRQLNRKLGPLTDVLPARVATLEPEALLTCSAGATSRTAPQK